MLLGIAETGALPFEGKKGLFLLTSLLHKIFLRKQLRKRITEYLLLLLYKQKTYILYFYDVVTTEISIIILKFNLY